MRRSLLLPALLLVASSLSAQATKDQAKALVKEAAAYLKSQGKLALLRETNQGSGRFHIKPGGDCYLFVFDLKGYALAHGAQSDMVNITRWDSRDHEGTYFVREFIQTARTSGNGWVDYKYLHPVTHKLVGKTSYVELVDGMVLGCGVYK